MGENRSTPANDKFACLMFLTLFLELFLQADCLSEQEVGEVKKALTNEMIADEADEPGVPPSTPVASETPVVTPPPAKKP